MKRAEEAGGEKGQGEQTPEVITKSVLEYLQQIQAMGGFISGCNDISLKTLKVVK